MRLASGSLLLTSALALACGGSGAPVEDTEPSEAEAPLPVERCDLDAFIATSHDQIFLRRKPGLDEVAIEAVPARGNVHLTGSRADGWLRIDAAYGTEAQEIHSGVAWIQPGAAAVFLVPSMKQEPPVLRAEPSAESEAGPEWNGEALVRACKGGWVQIDEGEGGRGWAARSNACGHAEGACGG